MSRGKEISVFLLDVGPKMGDFHESAAKAVSNVVLSKILFKQSHEAALVTYGTTGTDNVVHREFKERGDEAEYMHITEEFHLAPPTLEYMARLKELQTPEEEGGSDFVDALTVAADLIHKKIEVVAQLAKDNILKRVVLISNFQHAAQEDTEDWQFTDALVGQLLQLKIVLEVVCIDSPGDEEVRTAKDGNLRILERLLGQVHHRLQRVRTPAEMRGAFPFSETSATAQYSGPLTIAGSMTIEVKVTKKSCQERAPPWHKYSDLATGERASHQVEYSRSLVKGEGEEEEIVPSDETSRAYLYGNQLVPLSKSNEDGYSYTNQERSFKVIGVVSRDAIPRHYFFKDTWLVAPVRGNPQSFAALASLAHGLRALESGMLARFVSRANAEVGIGFLTSHFVQLGGPLPEFAGLLMNMLPFEEDIRWTRFASLQAKPELQPDVAEVAAMGQLMDAYTLDGGEHEQLATSVTPDPTLRNLLDVLTELQADPQARVSADDFPIELISASLSQEAKAAADKELLRRFPTLKSGKVKAQG